MRVLRTKDGARVSIIFKRQRLYLYSALWPHLVSMRLENIIHNPYLFVDCSIENGIAVVYWRGGEW